MSIAVNQQKRHFTSVPWFSNLECISSFYNYGNLIVIGFHLIRFIPLNHGFNTRRRCVLLCGRRRTRCRCRYCIELLFGMVLIIGWGEQQREATTSVVIASLHPGAFHRADWTGTRAWRGPTRPTHDYTTDTRTQLVRKTVRNSRRRGSKQQRSTLVVRSEEGIHLDPVARWSNKPTCRQRTGEVWTYARTQQHPRAHQRQREGQNNNDSIIPYRERG